MENIEDVLDDHTGLSRAVLEYTLEMKRTVDRAKLDGFDRDSWATLARFVDVESFERVGPFKDHMTWPEYVEFLTSWAPGRYWECSLRSITDVGDRVFVELEERNVPGDSTSAANSLSVYEFDDDGRLRHLAVYLQMAMPPRT